MDWTIVAALAAVAGAGFSWWQAYVARSQVKEAKAQAAAAKDAVIEAKTANDLVRMERSAGANQLFVAPDGKKAFVVRNPMPKPIYNLVVDCFGMANRSAFISTLAPNETQRLVLAREATSLDSVAFSWQFKDGETGRHRVSADDIWNHIERVILGDSGATCKWRNQPK